ncbi:MAG: hypothetical protein M0D55_09135 [Elusimicrobiota bacterium]|nr:MAG: hypothetical protein M0D55_09135 [Elusimicrobiota bacterium]
MEIAGDHHPAAGLGVARAYHGLLRAAPGFYGALYRGAWARSVLRAVRSSYLSLGGARRLREGVRRSGASVVVCPQAAVAAVLSEARRRGELDVPVVAVLTDFAAHPFWTDPPADLVLAPTQEAAAVLARRGRERRPRASRCIRRSSRRAPARRPAASSACRLPPTSSC